MYGTAPSEERTGHRRSVIVAALVLGVVTAGAWLLVRNRQVGRPVDLGEAIDLGPLVLRVRMPAGWTKTVKQASEANVALFDENGDETGRVLCLLSWPSSYAPGRQTSLGLWSKLRRIHLGHWRGGEGGCPAPLGPLSGWQLRGQWDNDAEDGEFISRVGWAPNGRAYVLALRSPRRLSRADQEAMEAICASVEIPDLRLTDRLEALSEATGIHFALPAGARVVEPDELKTALITIVAGEAEDHPWRIRVFRTWPRPDDDVAALVAAHRTEQWKDMSPLRHIEHKPVGVNDAWQTGTRFPKGWPAPYQASHEVWAVRHRSGLAAMILGESTGEEQKSLRATCDAIARSLRLTPSPLAPDEGQAVQLATDLLGQIARKGIDHWWTEAEADSWFLLSAGGRRGFIWQFRQNLTTGPRTGHFDGGGMTVIHYPVGKSYRNREDLQRWSVDADGDGFCFEQQIPPLAPDDTPVLIIDRREPGTQEGAHHLTLGQDRYDDRLTTPPNFLPDPLFELGLYLVARRPEGQSALFAGLGASEKMLHRRMCRSLGALPDDNGGRGERRCGVVVQIDYEPTPMTYVFDDRGRAIRVERGSHYVATRTTRSAVVDEFRTKVVERSLKSWKKMKWTTSQPASSQPATGTSTGPSTAPTTRGG